MEALRRLLEAKPRPRTGEHCEFCAALVAGQHSHVVSVSERRLLCACRACYLLFTQEGAAGGRYRSVPERYASWSEAPFSDEEWERLQIPVSIAFFFFNSPQKRTVAFYPSPAGATESLLPAETWSEVLVPKAWLGALAPDVEALLVYKRPAGFESYLVPIDACYELVGRMKRCWKGFDGGQDAWREIEEFFTTVRGRSEGVSAVPEARAR